MFAVKPFILKMGKSSNHRALDTVGIFYSAKSAAAAELKKKRIQERSILFLVVVVVLIFQKKRKIKYCNCWKAENS